MHFEWDVRKAEENFSRHGIDFEDAVGIFDGTTLEGEDDRFDYGETRRARDRRVRPDPHHSGLHHARRSLSHYLGEEGHKE